jgi:hypothetical protein
LQSHNQFIRILHGDLGGVPAIGGEGFETRGQGLFDEAQIALLAAFRRHDQQTTSGDRGRAPSLRRCGRDLAALDRAVSEMTGIGILDRLQIGGGCGNGANLL